MITANKWFKCSFNTYLQTKIISEMIRHGIRKRPVTSNAEPLLAYVNNGRWVVSCECGGAEFAWEEGLFMCRSCFNGKHKHDLRRSIFPDQRIGIEKQLVMRPLPNRNWIPSETLEDLVRENLDHKDELLEVI